MEGIEIEKGVWECVTYVGEYWVRNWIWLKAETSSYPGMSVERNRKQM